jgi:hypothetical protein
MPSPFPGMDPYLENPELWGDVHHELISTIRELINRVIRPKYVARVEERLYMVPDDDPTVRLQRIPDVEIDLPAASEGLSPRGSSLAIAEPVVVRGDPVREGRIEIEDTRTHEVVTVIELLSPSNKVQGSAGRESFVAKRNEVLNSAANWVEIDLLRAGTPHPLRAGRFRNYQYLVHSSPVAMRPDSKNWPILLSHPLPVVGIPLRAPDPDAPLDLQTALGMAYDRAAYDATVDYTANPDPPLAPALAKWAKKHLKSRKAR